MLNQKTFSADIGLVVLILFFVGEISFAQEQAKPLSSVASSMLQAQMRMMILQQRQKNNEELVQKKIRLKDLDGELKQIDATMALAKSFALRHKLRQLDLDRAQAKFEKQQLLIDIQNLENKLNHKNYENQKGELNVR